MKIAIAVGLLGVLSAAGFGAASVSVWRRSASPNVGELHGVAFTSSRNGWAVGWCGRAEHWNGKAWKVQGTPSPRDTTSCELDGVAAVSSRDAWAVGYYDTGNEDQVVIEHWNGKTWQIQPGADLPRRTCDAQLRSVTATSPRNVWAAGYYRTNKWCSNARPLIEHWNGKDWKIQAGANLPRRTCEAMLQSVTATSPRNVWAVGYREVSACKARPLIEHWDGKAWHVQHSPAPRGSLTGVAATSPRNAWAVGADEKMIVAHWNGRGWKLERVGTPPGAKVAQLDAVTAISRRDAWAVGYSGPGGEFGDYEDRTLIEHWNGKAWERQRSPTPDGALANLVGAAALSARDVWAVGTYDPGPGYASLIEHFAPGPARPPFTG